MPLLRLQPLRRALAAAVLLVVVWPSLSLLAGSQPNNALEPMDAADPSVATAPAASATPASSPTPAEAVTVSYSGTIRRTPTGGGPAVSGYLSLAISPLGKVSGSILWYNPTQAVKITGKQDLGTKQGSLVIRDANGVRVPDAPRLSFRISKKNRLVGSGILASGDGASFRLNREATYTGDGSAGGATLSLGGATYGDVSTVAINSGTFLNNPGRFGSVSATNFPGLPGTVSTGSSVTTTPTFTLGATGAINLTGTTTVITSNGASGSAPTISPDGSLLLGNTVLLLGPVTTTTGTDGTITYTGTYPSGAAGTVIVLGTVTGG